MLIGTLIGIIVIGFIATVIYVIKSVTHLIKKATILETTATGLQNELTQFKQGGFGKLVKAELAILTQKAADELESREKQIQQGHVELLEQQRQATVAAQQIHTGLGAVTTQLQGLKGLQVQVGELNDLLKPQQLRGELGEVIARTLISDKLPKSQYEEDYTFSDGKKVEFVIRLNNKLIPVDSKLQLEDFKRMREAPDDRRQALRTEFKRNIKQKIDEVKNYVRPGEGTFNFALMIIPSEAVYYDIVANKDFIEEGGLYDYARTQNVFLVSPLTFWAYLTAIAQGLHGLEIERRAEEILASLHTLSSRIQDFSTNDFRLLGEHLRNAKTKYDDAKERLDDIQEGLVTLKRLSPDHVVEQQGVVT